MDQTTTQAEPRTVDEPLSGEAGTIPTFSPLKVDERGRIILPSPEEMKARSDAIRRMLEVLRNQSDDDPPGSDEAILRAIDSHRPEGMKLFEGYH